MRSDTSAGLKVLLFSVCQRPTRRDIGLGLSLLSLLLASWAPLAFSKNWEDIPKEELAMKDDPANLGAPAIILYREVNTNDLNSYSKYYFRIKVLNDKGKDQANVEIPYDKDDDRVADIQARTVQPDGTSTEFSGDVFDKVIVKHHHLSIHVKTLTLPDVRVGSVIEYRYTLAGHYTAQEMQRLANNWVYVDSGSFSTVTWTVQQDLFTRRAHFYLKPLPVPLSWTWRGLPAGTEPQKAQDGSLNLDIENVAGLIKEEGMPPDEMLRSNVEFFYLSHDVATKVKTSDDFWLKDGKRVAADTEKSIGNPKSIQKQVDQVIAENDPAETKLRKLYAKAQEIRNLSFEEQKTEAEEKREKRKDNLNAADTLKRGYGTASDIDKLFVLMARAAGFDAFFVRVASRDRHLFDRNLMNWLQLDNYVVEVQTGSKSLFLDPATAHCPFGVLPWNETGVEGVRLDKEDIQYAKTDLPISANAILARKATLELSEDGTLKGRVQVTYGHQQTLDWRLGLRHDDEAGRRKKWEDDAKEWLPASTKVKLVSVKGWDKAEEPIEAEFDVEALGIATPTGHRLLLPQAIFQPSERTMFTHPNRVNAVYFDYPWQELDDITVTTPKGYRAESLPAPGKIQLPFGTYQISVETNSDGVHVVRRMVMDGLIFQVQYYPYLKGFFDKVKASDDQQLVLRSTEAHASN